MKNYSTHVANVLKNKGWDSFDVNKDNANGPDITISKNGKTFRAEIKKACFSSRSWKTTPVGISGKKCDLVIIILPNEELILQPMSEHLSLCSTNGWRFITKLVEINL